MTPQFFRLAYALEFLVALVAIFTAWSEIGGQVALDLMSWAWKFGLSFALAGAVVGYTAALAGEESLWNPRSARWLTAVIVIAVTIGGITYYYTLQEDNGGSDDTGNVSALKNPFGSFGMNS